jgi:hypothetical protein
MGLWLALLGCTETSSAAPSAAPVAKAVEPPKSTIPLPIAAPSTRDAAPSSAPTGAARAAVDWSRPDQAMAEFVRALHAQDAESFLQCFSRKKGFLLTGTSDKPHDSMRFGYAKLEQGLKPGGDFVGILFGGEGDDNFRDYVEQSGAAAWRSKQPTVFVPPIEPSLPVFVRWRKEGGRFVVEEIAFPAG